MSHDHPHSLAAERLSAAALAVAASAAKAENLALRADVAALVAASEVLSGVLTASGDCIKVLDLDGRILFVNDSGLKALEVIEPADLQARLWTELWPGEPAAAAAVVAARAGEDSQFTGGAPTLRGAPRHWDVRVTPVRSGSSAVTRILVISRDITEQHRLESQQALIADELEHRIKNMLAMVVAIAQQTLRPPASILDASESFTARMQALGRAQGLLTRTNWANADIRLVVDDALEPQRLDGSSQPFIITGPSIQLGASRALALALALHELATNALKYGALSVPGGSVQLEWRVEDAQLTLVWREAGGPAVTPPTRTGFGSKLLTRVFAAEFQGQVAIDYAPAGVVCTLTAPVA